MPENRARQLARIRQVDGPFDLLESGVSHRLAIDDHSKEVELARATASDILTNGYAVLCKGMDTHRIARQFGAGRNAVHSRLRQLGLEQNNEGIIANLAEVYLDPARTGETERLVADIVAEFSSSDGSDVVTAVRTLCVSFFELVDEAQVTDIQIFLWHGRTNPEIAERLRAIYHHIDGLMEFLVEQLLRRWGRVMRAPFTTGDLVGAVGAVIDGLILRRRLDRDSVSAELFGDLVLALVPAMTQPCDESTTEFTDFVAAQLGNGEPGDLLSTADLRTRAVQVVVQSLRAGHPRSSITIERVAGGVGLTTDLVRSALGSPEQLVATEVHQYAEMIVLRRPTADGYVEALASLASAHGELLSYFLSSAIEPHVNPSVRTAMELLAKPLDGYRPTAQQASDRSVRQCMILLLSALGGSSSEELGRQIAASS